MALLSLTIAARRSDNLRLNRSGLAHADAQIDLHIITDNYVDARIDDRMMWVVELKVTNGKDERWDMSEQTPTARGNLICGGLNRVTS
jgi:hypothetical protein